MDQGSSPTLRGFQFGGEGFGNLASSVNLFRGDVVYSQTLFVMPGRKSDKSMDVTVALSYQSNVREAAQTWNADAPTGPLGLGWAIPVSYIELAEGSGFAPSTQQFRYWVQGSPVPLVEEADTPWLFRIDAAASLLAKGSVPEAIANAFRDNGLKLGKDAEIVEDAGWTLLDPFNLREFRLSAAEGAKGIDANDGGRSFQLRAYKFWKILYYPRYERWLVTDENGRTSSFGGQAADGIVEGGSVEWGVCWVSPKGGAMWTGASMETKGQKHYARAWRLARIADIWGDTIRFGYNEFPKGEPFLTQQVGKGGLAYTKACYLTSITDVFGRRIEMRYAEKLFGTGESDPREYHDPHKAVPDDTPNGYQDRYQTKYLDRMEVKSDVGRLLFDVLFSYRARPEKGNSPAVAVANVTHNRGRLYGDTFKRYLTSVVMRNGEGRAIPSGDFEYFLDPDAADKGGSPGALAGVISPQGGTAKYRYQRNNLTLTDRAVTVKPPAAMSTATPSVWYGDDYAVTVWADGAKGKLSLAVYSWVGRWIRWELSEELLFDSQDLGISTKTLDVVSGDGFFALSFRDARSQGSALNVFVFRKDHSRPGQWVPASVDGVATAENRPTLSYADPAAKLHGGRDFLLVEVMNVSTDSGYCERLTWDWRSHDWHLERKSGPAYAVATGEAHYLLIGADGQVGATYLDARGKWQEAPAGPKLEGFKIKDAAIGVRAGMAALTYASSQGQDNKLNYRLAILQWDDAFRFADPVTGSYHDKQDPGHATSSVPVIASAGLVAVGPRLWRFDGTRWALSEAWVEANPKTGTEQRFAYGPDYAVRIAVQGRTANAAVVAYDPASGWQKPVVPGCTLPPTESIFQNWPVSGQRDYLSIGQFLYTRGTDTNWAAALAASPVDLREAVLGKGAKEPVLNTEAMVGEAPMFLAFPVAESRASTAQFSAVATLVNGSVKGSPQYLEGERIPTASDPGDARAGAAAGGPAMFVTYPAASRSFSQAPWFTLRHHAGQAIDGPIVHDAVAGVTFSNGFGETWPIAYVPDPKSAACDPSGSVVKYYSAAAWPGTADPAKPALGSIRNTYLNGLADAGVAPGDYYEMLDGLLIESGKFDADGIEIASSGSSWHVLTERSVRTGLGKIARRRLAGGYLYQTEQRSSQFGLETMQVMHYVPAGFDAPLTGAVIATTGSAADADGAEAASADRTVFAIELGLPGFDALHLLSAQAQAMTEWRLASGETATTKASATTYASFANADGAQIIAPCADFRWTGPSYSGFPFGDALAGTAAPRGWQFGGRVTCYTPHGLVAELIDAEGVASCMRHADERFPYAVVQGAALDECRFVDFEPNGDAPEYAAKGSRFVEGDAAAGTRSLCLPKGASFQASATPANRTQTYLLGWWCKTPNEAGGKAGEWTVAITMDGGKPVETRVAIKDTGGVWEYQTAGIPIGAGKKSVSLSVSAQNSGPADLLLDSVYLAPLCSTLRAQTFEREHHMPLTNMVSSGQLTRLLYDPMARLCGTIGSDGQLEELSGRSLSRSASKDGLFDPVLPNTQLTLNPAGGGTMESFASGDEWLKRWSPGARAAWSASQGALHFDGSKDGALCWQGALGDTASVSFRIASASAKTELAIEAGGATLRWAATGFSLSFKGKTLQAPLAAPKELPRSWLLVLGRGHLIFFADGRMIHSVAMEWDREAGVTITAGGALALRDLCVAEGPRLSVAYLDGAGRQRQAQQFVYDPAKGHSDALVVQSVLDGAGRSLAQTRTALASFGEDKGLPLLAYRPHFVDVPGFLEAVKDSWKMTGDIADFYSASGPGESDDQGYPYVGTRYIAAPLDLKVETAVPGKAQAIRDVVKTKPADRATAQIDYGLPGKEWKSGSFGQTVQTDPTKAATARIKNTLGQTVGVTRSGAGGETIGRARGHIRPRQSGASITVDLPNALVEGPQSARDNFRVLAALDSLGRVIERTDPSAGQSEVIYTPSGKPRFVRLPLEKGETGFVYFRYDALGRQIEHGSVATKWDRDALMAHVTDIAWPDAASAMPARSFRHDGDGSVPSLIGRIAEVVTHNRDNALPVSESYAYDAEGNVTRVTTQVDGEKYALAYRYNQLGQVVRIDYPAGGALQAVTFSYDAMGRVDAIGDGKDAAAFAAYSYTPDGLLAEERRNGGALVGRYSYHPAGWLEGYEVKAAGAPVLSLAYALGPNGMILSRKASSPGGARRVDYSYDGAHRLVSAKSDGPTGSETIDRYDANGNIWQATADGAKTVYTCEPGSDRLASIEAPGVASGFAYSAGGALLRADGLEIENDPVLSLPTRVTRDDTALRFAYGVGGHRVRKQIEGGITSTYLCGSGTAPLAVASGNDLSCLVYGPTGVVAIAGKHGMVFPVQDGSRTLWAMVDSANQVAARYDYLPFGGVISATGPAAKTFPPVFLGQQYDVETGLYDFRARFYSPQLRRFLSPDPASQFPSPYVFVANNPLSFTDPDGAIANYWIQIGTGVAMAAVAAVGFALSVFTGGASVAAAASVDATLAGGAATETVIGVTATVAGTAGTVGAVGTEATTIIAAESVNATVQAAATTSRLSAMITSVGTAYASWSAYIGGGAAYVGVQTACGAAMSAGTAGMFYDLTTSSENWSIKGFGEAVTCGAVSGLITGGASGLVTSQWATAAFAVKGTSKAGQIATRIGVKTAASVVGGEVSTVMGNAMADKPLYSGMVSNAVSSTAMGVGFAVGSEVAGALCDFVKARWSVSAEVGPSPESADFDLSDLLLADEAPVPDA